MPVGATLKLTLHVTTVTQVLNWAFPSSSAITLSMVPKLMRYNVLWVRLKRLVCPKLMPSKNEIPNPNIYPYVIHGISFYLPQTRLTEFQFDGYIASWGRLWTLNIVASRGNVIVTHRRIMWIYHKLRGVLCPGYGTFTPHGNGTGNRRRTGSRINGL